MFLFLSLARAACPADSAALSVEVTSASAAFTAMDREGLAAAVARMEAVASCLDEPVTPVLAARMHAAVALALFVEGDSDAAAQAFAAARAADATWRLEAGLVPKGHPLYALASRVDPASLRRADVPPPAEGQLSFDGAPGASRPTDAPTVAQWQVDGAVRSTGYLRPDSPMLPYDAVERAAGQGATRERAPVAWLAVAGAGLALSGGSFVLAADAHRDWEAATQPASLTEAYRRNHALWGVGAALGAVGLIGGVGAVVSLAW